jgi:hypothetical protein
VRIQIVHEDGTVLHVPALNQNLERDIRELFATHPRWRVFKRAHTKYALNEIERITAELRDATRY